MLALLPAKRASTQAPFPPTHGGAEREQAESSLASPTQRKNRTRAVSVCRPPPAATRSINKDLRVSAEDVTIHRPDGNGGPDGGAPGGAKLQRQTMATADVGQVDFSARKHLGAQPSLLSVSALCLPASLCWALAGWLVGCLGSNGLDRVAPALCVAVAAGGAVEWRTRLLAGSQLPLPLRRWAIWVGAASARKLGLPQPAR